MEDASGYYAEAGDKEVRRPTQDNDRQWMLSVFFNQSMYDTGDWKYQWERLRCVCLKDWSVSKEGLNVGLKCVREGGKRQGLHHSRSWEQYARMQTYQIIIWIFGGIGRLLIFYLRSDLEQAGTSSLVSWVIWPVATRNVTTHFFSIMIMKYYLVTILQLICVHSDRSISDKRYL